MNENAFREWLKDSLRKLKEQKLSEYENKLK